MQAATESDPAAKSTHEVITAYPGLFAITVRRIAHELYEWEVPIPEPNHITRHCGRVFGFKNKKEAVKIFKLLDEAKFSVEDIYFEDEDTSYKILNFN